MMAQEQAQVKDERKTVKFKGVARKYTPAQAAMVVQSNKHIIRHLLAAYSILRNKAPEGMKHKEYDKKYIAVLITKYDEPVKETA